MSSSDGEESGHYPTEDDFRDYCEKVVWCLMRFGGLDEAEARRRLHERGICDPKTHEDPLDRGVIMEEWAYYWAMEILHAERDPQWFNDRELALWPPPAEYFEEGRRRALESRGEPKVD